MGQQAIECRTFAHALTSQRHHGVDLRGEECFELLRVRLNVVVDMFGLAQESLVCIKPLVLLFDERVVRVQHLLLLLLHVVDHLVECQQLFRHFLFLHETRCSQLRQIAPSREIGLVVETHVRGSQEVEIGVLW